MSKSLCFILKILLSELWYEPSCQLRTKPVTVDGRRVWHIVSDVLIDVSEVQWISILVGQIVPC
jgi:hypothetical protein